MYTVKKYWDTYPDTVWKRNIPTLEEAKRVAEDAKEKTNYKYDYYKYDFYVFNENGVKVT